VALPNFRAGPTKLGVRTGRILNDAGRKRSWTLKDAHIIKKNSNVEYSEMASLRMLHRGICTMPSLMF